MSNATISGISEAEAKEFHGAFIMGFIGFAIVALIAHVLVWMWRPWFPGPDGYAMLENVQTAAASVIPFLA